MNLVKSVYKVNIQKSLAFLYTKNEKSEREQVIEDEMVVWHH